MQLVSNSADVMYKRNINVVCYVWTWLTELTLEQKSDDDNLDRTSNGRRAIEHMDFLPLLYFLLRFAIK